MDCENIKKLIPSYIKHTATQDDIKKVEEHLCICNVCREYLAKFMDKEEEFKEKIQHPEITSATNHNNGIEIVSEQEISQEEIPIEGEESPGQEDTQEESEPIKQPTEREKEEGDKAQPQEKKQTEQKESNFFEYLILLIGMAVLVFFVRLLMKG